MDRSWIGIAVMTAAAFGWTALYRPSSALEALNDTAEMFGQALPWIIVSMFAAGLLAQYVRPEAIARFLGPNAGIAGVALAAIIGICGTGSRWAAYPLAAGLLAAKASPGAVFAFMTTWQLVSLPRLPAEVPFLGLEFTVVRAIFSVVVAIAGGWLINRLPFP